MNLKDMGGITPLLKVDGEGVITAHNAATEHRLPHLRVGEHLTRYELADMTDDPAHFVCFLKDRREFCAYRPSPEYMLFPGLLRQGGRLLSGGFIPRTEEADHAHMLELIAASAGEGVRPDSHLSTEQLDSALAKLCFILMMDMQQGESVDVTALLELLRKRIADLFQRFHCSLRIDTVELDRHELYPILPVLWLNLLTKSVILLLHASETCRAELRMWEGDGSLYAELTADASLEALAAIAPLELAFNRIMAERSGMGLTLGESSRSAAICLSQKLCLGGELVLHSPTPFEEMRRDALLAEFDRLLGL